MYKSALYIHNDNRTTSVVEVVAVHHEPPDEPYYTIRFLKNARERQTVRRRLMFIG